MCRDIKSFNFLVDSQLVVKVADLELGSSSTNNSQSTFNNNNVHDVEANPSFYTNLNANGNGNNPLNAPKSDIMAFRSSMMMSSWQAPEVRLLDYFIIQVNGMYHTFITLVFYIYIYR